MTGNRLAAILDSLDAPTFAGEDLAFSVVGVPGWGRVLLGRSREGDPAILFPATGAPRPRAPIELRHLKVLFDARCRTSAGDDPDVRYTILRCSGERALSQHFLAIADPVVAVAGPDPSPAEVEETVRALVELFRAVSRPAETSVRGLWGELLLVARSRDPGLLVAAWHELPSERFDFAKGLQRLEVKTAGRSSREHHFSLDQLTAEPFDVLVASIQCEPSAGGASIEDILHAISERLTDGALTRMLYEKAAGVMGQDWVHLTGARFDEHLASSSVRFIRAADIPRPAPPLPVTVRQVTFVADTIGCPGVDDVDLEAVDGLWSAVRQV